jgi:hypothetical protein
LPWISQKARKPPEITINQFLPTDNFSNLKISWENPQIEAKIPRKRVNRLKIPENILDEKNIIAM